MKLDPDQQEAVELMCTAPIGIVTGPPGVGKTTITREVIRHFDSERVSYALCAPTGKAARRMGEATSREASTIHRLLAWTWQGFRFNEDQRLPFDVLLVDESSMIDTMLMAALLAAVETRHTRVIFIGDKDQLPPVGPGAPFRDMIASERVPIARLRTLHRAAQGSWIYRNAPKVLAGKGVEMDDCEDFEFHELGQDEAWFIPKAIVNIIESLKAEGTNPDDIQVLTPMRVREGGANELNIHLQAKLNNSNVRLKLKDKTLREGDRVMQTRNNYNLDVFNGEVGRINTIVQASQGLRVDYDSTYRLYNKGDLRHLDLAYATTIHKSQGAQFPIVIVVCHSAHKFMLSRQLLYTALTRARQRVFLVGDTVGVKQALGTIKDTQRRTLLRGKLADA